MQDRDQEITHLRDAVSSLSSTLHEMTERERLRRRLRWLTLLVLLVPTIVYAAQITIPNVFTNGTVADADEVNANFDALVVESNGQDTRLSALEAPPTFSLTNCALNGWANNWDSVMNASCPAGKVMNGMYSIHDNGVEDRRFQFRCCDIVEN